VSAVAEMAGRTDRIPTGLPWLPHGIPRHWDLIPNRGLLRKRKVLVGERHPEFDLLSLTKQGVIVRDLDDGGKFSSDMGTSQEVRSGDLVFCLFDVPETPRTVGFSNHNGMITGAYTVMECSNRTLARYLEYFYLAMDEKKRLSPLYSGLRNTIPLDHFMTTKSPVPPPEEQDAIVAFLDRKLEQIDRFIANKRRLIELLVERKIRVIDDGLTTGFRTDVKMSPTDTVWLPQIPADFKLKKFKYCATVRGGQVDPRSDRFKDMVLIAPNHIESKTGRLHCLETADEQGADSGKYLVQKGDVIYSKIRPALQKATIAPTDCLCSADMYAIHPRSDILPEYLSLWMLSPAFTAFAVEESMRVAMPKINREALGGAPVAYPVVEVQRLIISEIKGRHAKIDQSIERIEREITLMNEFRTSLIAEAVTGKIDLRPTA